MRTALPALMLFTLACSGATMAAMPNAKPGLWETASTIVIQAGLPSNVPNPSKLPPEQRAKLQQSLSPNGGKPITVSDRMCMSPEMLERWDAFASTSSADCQRRVVERTAQRVKFTMVCGGGKSSGEGEFTASGSDRVIGKMSMLTRDGGGDSKADIQLESRWISADCGALKPGQRQVLSR